MKDDLEAQISAFLNGPLAQIDAWIAEFSEQSSRVPETNTALRKGYRRRLKEVATRLQGLATQAKEHAKRLA